MKGGELILLGTLLGGLFLRSRAAGAEEAGVEEAGTAVQLQILDEWGRPVPHNSPADVVEGTAYILRATVKNTSSRLGVGVIATLTLYFIGSTDTAGIAFKVGSWPQRFAAGETIIFDNPFTMPDGVAGQNGYIDVAVESPNRVTLASARELLTIGTAPLLYGATVTLAVP